MEWTFDTAVATITKALLETSFAKDTDMGEGEAKEIAEHIAEALERGPQ